MCHNGVPNRVLDIIDEYTRECMASKAGRRLIHKDVLEVLQILIEMWRKHCNTVRQHSALDYQPPAPAAIIQQPSQIQQIALRYKGVYLFIRSISIGTGGRSTYENIII